jgi:uncharacterized protein YxjI
MVDPLVGGAAPIFAERPVRGERPSPAPDDDPRSVGRGDWRRHRADDGRGRGDDMGLLHRHEGPPVRRFQMREKLISIGDDYWIEDESGQKVFKVNGKVARIRDTWELEDASGSTVAEIREKKLSVRDTISIEWNGTEATVKKALIGIRDRYHIEVDGGEDLKAHGDIVDHEYEIERDGDKVAEVSKKWFRLRDTYGVEIEGDVDPVLILSITVAIDALAHRVG